MAPNNENLQKSLEKEPKNTKKSPKYNNRPPHSPPSLNRQMAQLSISSNKKKKNKQSKLISSKSISALIPNLFSRSKSNPTLHRPQQVASTRPISTKSFSVTRRHPDSDEIKYQPNQSHLNPSCSFDNSKGSSSSEWTFDQASLSPIAAPNRDNVQHVLSSSPVSKQNHSKVKRKKAKNKESGDKEPANNSKSENQDNGKRVGRKLKALRSTALDVKNSIALRIRARNQNQAFARLTNELETPDSKLYSPFNIYTDSCTKGERNLGLRSKQIRENEQFADCSIGSGSSLAADESHATTTPTTSPKQRIALRHKKHLLNEAASKFNFFVSPAGKHHEAVRDVENLQRHIEDISLVIKARGQLRL